MFNKRRIGILSQISGKLGPQENWFVLKTNEFCLKVEKLLNNIKKVLQLVLIFFVLFHRDGKNK